MNFTHKLEVWCDGSNHRNSNGQWCLAEATFYGRFLVTQLLLAGWRLYPNKLLCPECSGGLVIKSCKNACDSNGFMSHD